MNGRRFRLLLPTLLMLSFASTLAAAPTPLAPEAWLTRMSKALATLNYEGVFVYLRRDHVETLKIIHRGDNQGGRERVVSLTGPKREIVRDHKEVKCISPSSRSVLVERRYRAAPGLTTGMPSGVDAAALAADYRFSDLGEGRVAGISTRIIRITPRDGYRYGYKLWLDARTGMLMRSDLLDGQGRSVERVVFTSLHYLKHVSDAALAATEIKPGYVWNMQGDSERPLPEEARAEWQTGDLPAGFKLSLSDVQRVAGVAHPVRHLVYSDGLASVSVFAEPASPGRKVLIGASHMGAVNAYGRNLKGWHLTVVGEVPAATVKMIAQAMQLKGNSAE